MVQNKTCKICLGRFFNIKTVEDLSKIGNIEYYCTYCLNQKLDKRKALIQE